MVAGKTAQEVFLNETVSVIMPVYNTENFVADAIKSVQAQTFSDWQLFVCDDGSTDKSLGVVQALAKVDSRISVLMNTGPEGAAGARNTCLSNAKGRYIAFLDSDDLWLPTKLESQVRFMEENKVSFAFGYCQNISEEGDQLSTAKAPASISLRKLLFSNFIPCLTVIYDSHTLGKLKQPNIERSNDFALWLRILKENKNLVARCYPEVVARYRVNSYGLSANKISGIKYFYRCLRQYAGLNKAAAGFCTFIAIGFKGLKTLSPRMYNVVVTKLL